MPLAAIRTVLHALDTADEGHFRAITSPIYSRLSALGPCPPKPKTTAPSNDMSLNPAGPASHLVEIPTNKCHPSPKKQACSSIFSSTLSLLAPKPNPTQLCLLSTASVSHRTGVVPTAMAKWSLTTQQPESSKSAKPSFGSAGSQD